jgi:hypothetical protein
MPKVKSSLIDKLKNQVKLNSDYQRDGTDIFCKVCSHMIPYKESHLSNACSSHMKSQKHIELKKKNSQQITLLNSFNKSEDKNVEFKMNLLEAFIKANIPLNKLNNKYFKKFLQSLTTIKIPDQATLRKGYVSTLYNKNINLMKNKCKNKKFYIIADETTDSLKRKVLNLMIGILDGNKTKPMLYKVSFIESTDSDTVYEEILNSFLILFDSIPFQNFCLFLSDGASYMLLCGKKLKIMFKNLMHITCFAHLIHRLCEKIRDENYIVDEYISSFKMILSKGDKRLKEYKEETSLPLPPEPVIVRWCTWLECTLFHQKNFSAMKKYIEKVGKDKKSNSFMKLKNLIKNNNLEKKLNDMKKYKNLIILIKKLERNYIEKNENYSLIESLLDDLQGSVKEKLIKLIKKNPDYDGIKNNYNNDFIYAPVVTCDIERTFSVYKNLLSDERCKFTNENLEKMMIISVNNYEEEEENDEEIETTI